MPLNLIVQCSRSYSRRILCHSVSNQRFLNTNIKQYGNLFNKNDDGKKKPVKVYLLQRVLKYIQNYEEHLEKQFPTAMRVYKVFTEGVHIFFKDLKDFAKIMKIVYSTTPSLDKLTRREIELYHQMPKDVAKVAPTLILASLPFTLYVILPLVYLFPRQLLTSHFWTLQQKSEFKTEMLQNRLTHNRPVFRHLQGQLKTLRCHPLHEKWSVILGQLGSGIQPSVDQILECQELFARTPYQLKFLPHNHIVHLSKMHDTSTIFRRKGLYTTAEVLQAMDRAIIREGGVHNMPIEAMKNACFLRGLNPINMKNEDMITWLNQWVKVSEAVNEETYSLLLHCPILLGYNQPSNWTLLYPYKE